ncbi:hypothetical protein [Bathymodiolus platifrons methanotrophic gill symbiont]|uniref:hypothetical protein n=1 Tax=Bathymodiolus platifrons methanotrophic gill symbiont TaxID=113268 RepID=UPI000B41D9BF|nr:hypothetical protein [Bathymodiolus platifrons methanotrophic gill symbiont]
MKQSLEQDRWFIVKQLLLLTEKEVKHLRMTSDRIKALDPNLQWIETLENNIEYSEMLDAFVSSQYLQRVMHLLYEFRY